MMIRMTSQRQQQLLGSGTRTIRTAVVFIVLCFLVRSTKYDVVDGAAAAVAPPKTRVTWVNGIAHSFEHVLDGTQILSNMFGGKKVQFSHNPTAMSHEEDYVGIATDLLQAGTQKFGRNTDEVNVLVRHLRDAVKSVGRKGVVVHIAHSQGALITYLAAKQLTQEEMTHIECICFGGAAAITRAEFPSFRRIVNYYSVNDPLLFVVPCAAKKLQSGIFVSKDDEYVFLTPRSGNPTLDHALFGPTYGECVAWEGRRFQNQYQHVIVRSTRPFILKVKELFALIIFTLMVDCFLKPIYMYIRDQLEETCQLLWSQFILPLLNLLKLLLQLVVHTIRVWRDGGKYESLVGSSSAST